MRSTKKKIFRGKLTIKGQIVKVTASKYYVLINGETLPYGARGAIKYNGDRLVVGDFVEVENGVISKIYPRKSKFIRPNVANVDCVNLVIASVPEPDFLLVDKIIATTIYGGAKIILTVNKADLSGELYDYVIKNYSSAVDKMFFVSAKTGEGVEELKAYLKDLLVVFIGQSAVGKTSLCNSIFNFEMKVGELSDKTQRGKHTTTSSQIFYSNGFGVVDTPGFNDSLCDVKAEDLSSCYLEFEPYLNSCFFLDCKHVFEPNCAIKNAVEKGEISLERYNRYVEIYKNLLKDEKNAKY